MTRFLKDESGQGMIEYVLIIALVAVIAVIAIVVIRNIVQNKADDLESEMATIEDATGGE
ncbi:MAG: Flp family type IVb pilin [Eubacteriales bacterium]|nr:Flp family type IVb pilin [Eubacteriales bacterium]